MGARAIFKIEVPQGQAMFTRGLPADSVFLAMQQQRNSLMSWWSVPVISLSETSPPEMVEMGLCIVGTGEPWDEDKWKHLGTASMTDGYVWHLLVRREASE